MIINNQNNTRKNSTFGNAALLTTTMNFLATNEAIGATTVDLTSMVIPRTAIDSTRTPEAGMETFRREIVSCILYAALGLFGLSAAMVLAPFSSAKKYEVPLHKITAGDEAIDTMAHSWNKALETGQGNKEKVVTSYLNEIIGSVSGVNGEKRIHINSDGGKLKGEIVSELNGLLLDESKGYNLDKEQKHKLIQKIIHSAGSSENLKLEVPGSKAISIAATDLLDNTYVLGRAFMNGKVAEEFKSAGKDNNFIKNLKNFNSRKMWVGLGVASAFALSMQAINRWMTQKKTGSAGFVAYKGEKGEKDNSLGFKAMKVAASAAMVAFMVGSIAGFKNTLKNLKEIPKQLKFTRLMPNMAQYKLVYGVTIIGRFLASSDKNELRESVTRDFLGFTSWLILGDIAARKFAQMFEKSKGISLLNRKDDSKKMGLLNSYLKTHEEILYANTEQTLGKSVKDASKIVSDQAKTALRCRNIAQIGGYVVSGLLLGIGIPLFNKFVTDNSQKKKAARKNQIA